MDTIYIHELKREIKVEDLVRMRIDLAEFKKIKAACHASTHVDEDTTPLQASYRLGQQNVLDRLRDGIVIERA